MCPLSQFQALTFPCCSLFCSSSTSWSAFALVTVILMQRSEGGGLTGGGSPAELMSARGASDFLTRSTAILATAFVILSIVLAFLAATRHATTVDTSINRAAPAAPAAPAQPLPNGGAFGGDAANAAAGVGGGSANLSFPGVTNGAGPRPQATRPLPKSNFRLRPHRVGTFCRRGEVARLPHPPITS